MTDGVNLLVRNRHLVEDLGGALRSGKHGLVAVPGLLKRILVEESWREFVTQRGEHVHHDHFSDFATMQPLKGIGASRDLLESICHEHLDVLDLLGKAWGRKRRSDRSVIADSDDNIINTDDHGATRGTSREYALRKLGRDAPELHARVLAGDISPHAAMVEAGFRPPSFTVRATAPDVVAATLRRRLPPEWLADIAKQLAS